MAVWVLGDQLSRTHGPLADRSDGPVLMIESRSFARRYPYHPHKLTLVLSAMRHLRDELREAGREVAYYRTGTFREGVERFLEDHPGEGLVAMEPASHGGGDRLRELVVTVAVNSNSSGTNCSSVRPNGSTSGRRIGRRRTDRRSSTGRCAARRAT